jgi:hypothetical protein
MKNTLAHAKVLSNFIRKGLELKREGIKYFLGYQRMMKYEL